MTKREWNKLETEIYHTSTTERKKAKAACEWAYAHREWTYRDIYSAYGKPSFEKVRAWEYCKNLCAEMDGFDMLISARNVFAFSVCFQYVEKTTGVLSYAYITRDYNRFCAQ